MLATAQFEQLAAAARQDPEMLMARCFWVATKNLPGQPPITRLELNPAQRKVHRAIMAQRQKGQPPRVIVCKARQPGISSLGAAYLTASALTQPHSGNLMIAHLDDPAVTLFKKVQFMLERLPDALRPSCGAARRNEVVLDELQCSDGRVELRSRIAVVSATGGEQWRGLTLQTVHASEFGYWPRPEEALLGIMQAVPSQPNSLVVIESTAAGMGNMFQEEYDRAKSGASDFVPVFIPWFEIPEYRMLVPDDFELEPDEKEIKRAFHLTNEQMQWRRYTLFTSCGGNVDRFCQEYPSTDAEAFLLSGRPAFPVKVLREMNEVAHAVPLCTCVPIHSRSEGPPHLERGLIVDGKFVRIARGPLAVYRRPVAGHDYTIGADPSAGEEGSDPAAIAVFDRDTGEFVAIWHGYQNPVVFAHTIAALGRWYNMALLAPEVNNHGHVVMAELKNIQYQRFYVWQRADKIRNTFSNYYGWWCVDPEAKILTADLRWVPARDVVLGDRLMGCRETIERGRGRLRGVIPLRVQTVVDRRVFIAPRIEVTMADGRCTRVSSNHPFLTYCRNTGYRWVMASDLRPGDRIKGVPMWDTLRSYEAGRLSAFLDGEGHLARVNRMGGYALMVSQAEGSLAEEIYDLWLQLGFEAVKKYARHRKRPHRKVLVISGVRRFSEVLRALGSLRPTRLLSRWHEWAQSDGTTIRSLPRIAVETVRAIGEGPVVGFTTDPDHTLIADGLLGHNTTFATRPLLIDTFNHALTEREIVIYHPETVAEFLRFQWVSQTRAEGLTQDDLAFAAMIAYRAHLEMPLLSTGLPPRLRFPDPETPPVVHTGPPLNNLSEQAWAETDRTVTDMQRGHDRFVDQHFLSDSYDPSAPVGLEETPDYDW